MRKIVVILFLLCVFALTGCEYQYLLTSGDAIIPVSITDNGISTGVSDITITNLKPGRSTRAVALITNGTDDIIKPSIYPVLNVDPMRYDKASSYNLPPENIVDWLEIDDLYEIQPNGVQRYVIGIEIPKDAKPPDRFTFQIGFAGNSGGFMQTAVAVWWFVDTR